MFQPLRRLIRSQSVAAMANSSKYSVPCKPYIFASLTSNATNSSSIPSLAKMVDETRQSSEETADTGGKRRWSYTFTYRSLPFLFIVLIPLHALSLTATAAVCWLCLTEQQQFVIKQQIEKSLQELSLNLLDHPRLVQQGKDSAMQIIELLLKDPILYKALMTLCHDILASPEILQSIYQLLSDTISHPDTIKHLSHVIYELLNHIKEADPASLKMLGELIADALQTPAVHNAVKHLIQQLSLDEQVYRDLSVLVSRIVGESSLVKEAVGKLLTDASMNVLSDRTLRNHSQQFVVDVISDETVHQVAGEAITDTLYNTVQSVTYASMTKGWGASIVAMSAVLISVIISPY